MKQILSLIMAILAIGCGYAQQTSVATLSKASTGEVTQYFGSTGLQEAYAAAETGDAIYLSPGSFQAVDIEKIVKITGAGMTRVTGDTISSVSTTITNAFKINFEKDSINGNKFCLEGVTTSGTITISGLHGGSFVRCTFQGVIKDNTANIITDCSFINCNISQCNICHYGNNVNYQNCYIHFTTYVLSSENQSFAFNNCYIEDTNTNHSSYLTSNIRGTVLNNCIARAASSATPTCTLNFTAVSSNIKTTSCVLNGTNYYDFSTDSIQSGTFYKLTEGAATKYIGEDGTEVGIYGGLLPFETTPTNPQITSLSVDAKSNSDGLLPITIQVK